MLTLEETKTFVKALLEKAHNRFKQEIAGENEELLPRVIREFQASVARRSWKVSQKWCMWNNEGPVLMPDYTRLYYRKGSTEVIIQEFPPQIRLMKFMGTLAARKDSSDVIQESERTKIYQYSLALPYMVFIFKYVHGDFSQVRCAFSDRPLKRLEEKPLKPYLSNLDSNLNVCLGRGIDRSQLIKGNIVQQCSYILSHFWQSIYSDEWSSHFWQSKTHFTGSDPRMATLNAWQEASTDNPLFVIEDVKWLQATEESFGDMVVKMFEGEQESHQLEEELYNDLVENFLQEINKTFQENLDNAEEKVVEATIDQLSTELFEKLNQN